MTNKQIIERLNGVIPPVVTPFDRRGRVDEGAFRENLQRYASTGVAGVLVAGSTGETAFLTDQERLRLVEIARDEVKPPRLLMAGAGMDSTAHTIALSREAVSRGADAILALPPSYYKPFLTVRVLEDHYRTVARSVRRPVLIYSIPQFTGFTMDAAMLGRLSRRANILGIKESSGKLDFDRAILRESSRRFHFFSGSALVLPEVFDCGACGAILSQANFEPQICVGLYEAWRRGDAKLCAELRDRLAILARKITGPFGVPGVKYALDLSDFYGGIPRPPLAPLSSANRRIVAAALKEARAGLQV